ncbi:hypothetical protein DFJ58DRAFT_731525 [Suillus subalutaceus]|uniref:uncharacterized protein n=1 Tax=Suillus subalutaceus TaxID=48586 RepID=UPI001B86E4E5|nr:uncharacterized protein DFJ58DRAFT_731525 [Suillus subalutaceus]KAG1843580.1 hypothetical protein DFJ58DRAFT_731525 [Suillus subalutaceus]
MTINLRALSTRASGLADDILNPHHQPCDDTKPGTRGTDLYELLEAIGYLSIPDQTNSEAKLVMDLAQAKREVFWAQKALADYVAEKTLDDADMGLGCMRLAFKQNGWSHCPLSASQCEDDHQHPENSSSATIEVPNGHVVTIQLD